MAKITVRRFHLSPFLPRLSLSALHDRLPFVYLTMPRRFAFQEPEAKDEEKKDWTHAYADDLKTEVYTEVNADPNASVHATEDHVRGPGGDQPFRGERVEDHDRR
jgi:hypothetical protein